MINGAANTLETRDVERRREFLIIAMIYSDDFENQSFREGVTLRRPAPFSRLLGLEAAASYPSCHLAGDI
jgi:hypothetical protein